MKKVLFAIVAVAGIACACTKDLEDRVGVLEKKVAALEEAVNTNADAISELKTAAANSVAITSVEKKDGYYEIKFANGTTAKLHDTSIIGVKEIDGVLYWTNNGEILQNNGVNVRVSDAAPKFKYEDNTWKVSYDEGATWNAVTFDTKEVAVTMEETAEEYVFTIADVKIHVAKDKAFAIKVTSDEIEVYAGDVVPFKYSVTGADEKTHVYVDAKGYTVKTVETDNASGVVYVTVPSELEEGSYVVIKAVRNSDGKSSAQYITIKKQDPYGTFGGVIITDYNEYLNW